MTIGRDGGVSGPTVSLEYSAKPSATRYMLGALRPSRGLSRSQPATRFSAEWSGHRIETRNVARFLTLAGLRADGGVSILYPHVFGFPLQMALLTHREFPVPIWRMLQIRNHLVQHRPIAAGATLDFEVRVAKQRILERGAEFDLHTTVRADREFAWESLVTFFTRGRFKDPETASALAPSPDVRGEIAARWRMPRGGSWRMGQFTGDHNGIHNSKWYARRLGFRGALYHPPVVLGHCLSRLGSMAPDEINHLDAWIKGPVYRGAEVALRAEPNTASTECAFALTMEAETRPSVVGRVGKRIPERVLPR